MMATPLQSSNQLLPEMGPAETALYTKDTLESLRKIALQQRQLLLAHLLELAAVEARSLGKAQSQQTLPPNDRQASQPHPFRQGELRPPWQT